MIGVIERIREAVFPEPDPERHVEAKSREQEAMERGVALLDKKSPGWWMEVDTDNLDSFDPTRCVLKQVYGGYNRGLSVLGIPWSVPGEPIKYGFCPLNTTASREALNQAWVDEINRRRSLG